ncbi:MAG: hypothetical protein AAGB48_07625 [Planctomycetota bacterium]
MSDELSPTTPRFAQGPCIDCGYDLLGTPIETNCPECGKAVSELVPEFPISAQGPAAALSIRNGATIATAAVCLWLLSLVGAPFFGRPILLPAGAACAGTIIACWHLIAGFGTAPRPRAALVVQMGTIGLAATLVLTLGLHRSASWFAIAWFACLIGFASTSLIAVGYVIQDLARRIPSYRALCAAQRYRRWAVILSIASAMAPFAVWGLAQLFLSQMTDTSGYAGLSAFLGALMLVSVPLLIITVIAAVMFFIMTARLRGALKPLTAQS